MSFEKLADIIYQDSREFLEKRQLPVARLEVDPHVYRFTEDDYVRIFKF